MNIIRLEHYIMNILYQNSTLFHGTDLWIFTYLYVLGVSKRFFFSFFVFWKKILDTNVHSVSEDTAHIDTHVCVYASDALGGI